MRESTAPDPNDNRTWRANTWFTNWPAANGYYKYLWWGKLQPDGAYNFLAMGHLGQFIYVSPQENTIIVRHGISDEGVDHWDEVLASVVAKIK